MSHENKDAGKGTRGVVGSLGLAFRISLGSLRLLAQYPVLILPLLPVFVMVLLTMAGLNFISNLYLGISVIFAVAYALMFSFAITTNMLKQIDDSLRPSLFRALADSNAVRMLPRVLLLSAVWYALVAILVAIETAVRTLLDRISDDLGEMVINAVFGTIADALRMAGFMMVTIMVFEETGFSQAMSRLKQVVKENPIVAVGGLTLTKMATFAIFGIIFVLDTLMGEAVLGLVTIAVGASALAMGWVLAMYLEQMFMTGLYLYATKPHSKLVEILLHDQLGRELPIPPRPAVAEQPAQ